MLTRIKLEKFTAFRHLDIDLNPGINVFVGANATGKSHLLKVAYAACEATRPGIGFSEKLNRLFLPSKRALGRLVMRQQGSSRAVAEVWRGQRKLRISFSNHALRPSKATVTGRVPWSEELIESVFIPVKEMLSHGPGFGSLYRQREIHFEEIYADILDRAYRPALRGPTDRARRRAPRQCAFLPCIVTNRTATSTVSRRSSPSCCATAPSPTRTQRCTTARSSDSREQGSGRDVSPGTLTYVAQRQAASAPATRGH